MTAQDLVKKQEELQNKIGLTAEKLGLTTPVLEPIYDGVSDAEGYLASKPRIMWILKEPYDDKSPEGIPKGGGWSLTEHLGKNDVWKDLDMWKLMIQINYSIHNNLKWEELDYIENNQAMADELKKTAYINLSKMPNRTSSSASYLWQFYGQWKNILFEQIDLYKPEIIIFGHTFSFFMEDMNISGEPIYQTTVGQWTTKAYKKDGILLIDAYHPSRKGGEDAGTYVSSVIETTRKAMS